jgi:hypothetical protein
MRWLLLMPPLVILIALALRLRSRRRPAPRASEPRTFLVDLSDRDDPG